MKKVTADFVVRKFLRSYLDAFSAKEFAAVLSRLCIKTSAEECSHYLRTNGYVFALENGLFVTRAGVFTGKPFSFRPTRREIEKGAFITGHRCMPFVDPEFITSDFTFKYKGTALPVKVIDFDSSSALDLFRLYGEEFSTQYIAADPANEDIDIAANDFLLPADIKLTGFSLEPLIKSGEFKSGDRLLCRVKDWDAGIIDISVLPHKDNPLQMNMQDLGRESWYSVLEQALLKSFDTTGPCSSIEEQLARVFADNRTELCIRNCGAVEELFSRSKKVGLEQFGVETRLWRLNENVPAFGKWNSSEETNNQRKSSKYNQILNSTIIPEFLIDSYIKDQLYNKADDLKAILTNLLPDSCGISSEQRQRMLLHLANRHDILIQKYNQFADYDIGAVRHKALELYSAVNALVCSIDVSVTDLSLYPQQPLVILSQISNHVLHIIELIETDTIPVIHEVNEIDLSLEGMKFNFECISDDLKNIIEEERKNGFIIIK